LAVLLSLLIFAVPVFLYAGTTGKIAGKVTDKSTGEPLPGANVVIVGTDMGAAADIRGEYYILNVPVGKYSVRVSMMGYNPITATNVAVTIDHTTSLDFALEPTVLEAQEIVVVAERPMIQKDNTMTRQFISSEQIEEFPMDSFTDIVSMQAGAVGANIRGGRASGTIIVVDGISLQDPMTGYGIGAGGYRGLGGADASLAVDLPDFAFEEIEMVTGGFNAEYGNAQDAILNIATKEGGSKHTGRVRFYYENDKKFSHYEEKDWYINPALDLAPSIKTVNTYGDSITTKPQTIIIGGKEYTREDIEELKRNSKLDPLEEQYVESTPIWTETIGNYQRSKVLFSLGGPLPGKATYMVSGEYLDQKRGRFVNQDRKDYSFMGKLSFKLSPKLKVNVSSLLSKQDYGLYDYEATKYQGGYWPGYGPLYPEIQAVPRRIKKNDLETLVLTHTLSEKTYYTVTLGRFHSEFSQKMRDYDDRDGDGNRDEYVEYKWIEVPEIQPDGSTKWKWGWRFFTDDMGFIWTQNPTKIDTSLATYDSLYKGEWKIGVEGKSQWKEIWYATYDPDTKQYTWRSEWRFVTGDVEWEETGFPHQEQTESTVYGIPDEYWIPAGDIQYQYRDYNSDVYTIKTDLASQVNPRHFIQTGLEWKLYDLNVVNIMGFSASNLYLDNWDQKPYEFAFYIRDKIEMVGMIVNAGLRFDYYNLNGLSDSAVVYSANATDPLLSPIDPAKQRGEPGYKLNPVEVKGGVWNISPRLGISHPITERDVLHFSYNHF
ncbi:MAG: carboxypeptidase-like regulatory domain-containing protein, partial [Fidelibacterota bacterium]